MKKQSIRSLSPLFAAATLVAISFLSGSVFSTAAASDDNAVCGTGHYEALLTGWTMGEMTPRGTARYTASDKRLEIEVEKVNLKDGIVLDVRIGDDKVGKMQPLKENSAKAVIVVDDELDEKSRVRIFNDDVPILSANLSCDSSASPAPTAESDSF